MDDPSEIYRVGVNMHTAAQDVALYLSFRFERFWPSFGFYDLQRLLFLSQGWHLARGDGPLFADEIIAHRAAPIVSSIKGLFPKDEMLPKANMTPFTISYLDSFCKTYASIDSAAVRRQVEGKESAWTLARAVGGENCLIPHALMESTFRLSLLNFAATTRSQSNYKNELRARKNAQSVAKVLPFRAHSLTAWSY